MRIVAAAGDSGGCGFYRVILPLQSIAGHDVEIISSSQDPRLAAADLLVVQRISNPEPLQAIKEFQARGGKVLLDFDDHLHALPSSNPCAALYGTGKPATRIFEEALSICDVITCSTRDLAREYNKFRTDIHVCENFVSSEHVDLMAPRITGEPKREGQIRIGYVGSTTHGGDVGTIVKPLRTIAARYPQVRYVFMGQPPPAGLRAEHHPGVQAGPGEKAGDFMLRFYRTMRQLNIDIGLAPLESQTFNRTKSWIKVLEYGMQGIPVVASRVGPYRDYLGAIYCVLEDKEWVTRLSQLIERESDRADMAIANLGYIREHHTTAKGVVPWQKLIDGIAGASCTSDTALSLPAG